MRDEVIEWLVWFSQSGWLIQSVVMAVLAATLFYVGRLWWLDQVNWWKNLREVFTERKNRI
jgi:hypothetical protein